MKDQPKFGSASMAPSDEATELSRFIWKPGDFEMAPPDGRPCLLPPASEVFTAARLLRSAVEAHLIGNFGRAKSLFKDADMPAVRAWTERLWGKNNRDLLHVRRVENAPPLLPKHDRVPTRMPTAAERSILIERDGYHCRFCGVPVIPAKIRGAIHNGYPEVVPWGRTNASQHAAFQAMWLQYDHILPHARGGDNSLENTVITCAPCNYGRMNYTLSELGLADPRMKSPLKSEWTGLIEFCPR